LDFCNAYFDLITVVRSQVPKAVDAWRGELQAKNRPKIAAGIAHPADNPDLFEEGWEEALKQEQKVTPTAHIINGRQCEHPSINVRCFAYSLILSSRIFVRRQ
jgi:hypothetical protein